MKDMRIIMVAVATMLTSLAFLTSSALANPAEDLEECHSIAIESERLACLEAGNDQLRAAGMTPDSVLRSSVPDADPSASGPKVYSEKSGWLSQERKLFGLRVPFTGGSAKSPVVNGVERDESGNITGIISRVTEISSDPRGMLTVTLENGQRWRQKDGRIKAKVGESAVIRSAAMGSYFMKIGRGRAVRATRVEDSETASVVAAVEIAPEGEAAPATSELEAKEGMFARFGQRLGFGKDKTNEVEFGKTPANIAKEQEDDPSSMTQKVVASMVNPRDEFIITLENGQVWQQVDGVLRIKVGDSVTIDKSGLGSHFLQVDDKGRPVRVRRIE